MKNTLAYYATTLIKATKSFIMQAIDGKKLGTKNGDGATITISKWDKDKQTEDDTWTYCSRPVACIIKLLRRS